MNAIRILTLLLSAALAVLVLGLGPAVAQDEPADDGVEEVEADQPDDADDHRITIAETPRDRVGLLLLGALAIGGIIALVQGRRQMKGQHEQASGDFRWR